MSELPWQIWRWPSIMRALYQRAEKAEIELIMLKTTLTIADASFRTNDAIMISELQGRISLCQQRILVLERENMRLKLYETNNHP